MHADIVVDLGFGDAGKGILTDALVRKNHAGLVVRYNGGAQAGHHVVTTDGRRHTFSQFGSGSFVAGTRTFLSRYMIIHPTALLLEGDALVDKGLPDIFTRIRISENCLMITPYHQAANRIREMARGFQRHGTCGVGIGEVAEDVFHQMEDVIKAGDLASPKILREKFQSIRNRKKRQLISDFGEQRLKTEMGSEWQFFEEDDLEERWLSLINRFQQLKLVAPDELLADWFTQTDHVIFEGAQGMLLDADTGFYPYNSWTNASVQNAHAIIAEYAPEAEINSVGVARCYMVRHGPGPLPTENGSLTGLVKENNRENEWQGRLRYGWWDGVLMRYALREAGQIDYLAITHLDVLSLLERWYYCDTYEKTLNNIIYNGAQQLNQNSHSLESFRSLPLEQKQSISEMLMNIRPALKSQPSHQTNVIRTIEGLLQRRVNVFSKGNTFEHVIFDFSN